MIRDALDRRYTPLNFSSLAARQGTQVDLLFVLWSVRMLIDEGAGNGTIDPRRPGRDGRAI